MPSRDKRLKKGIESLQKQISLHEKKLNKTQEEGKLELIGYYKKEIESKKRDKEKKNFKIYSVGKLIDEGFFN